MKKKLILSVMTCLSIGGIDAVAQEQGLSLKTGRGLEIGLQSYRYEYEEEVNGAFFMSNKGYKYGVSLAASETIGDEYYLKGEARFATGDVEYNSASGTGDVSDDVYEARMLVGKEAYVENYLLGSYTGVGYRLLKNDLRDLGSGGYRRKSEYLYIPIGVTHRFRTDAVSRVTTNIEYDYFAWGEQKSYLSDVSPVYAALFGDQINKQKHGYGVRLNTAYEQENWSVGAFFNYWKIGDSEKNTYIVPPYIITFTEPKNETQEIGIEIKYRF